MLGCRDAVAVLMYFLCARCLITMDAFSARKDGGEEVWFNLPMALCRDCLAYTEQLRCDSCGGPIARVTADTEDTVHPPLAIPR